MTSRYKRKDVGAKEEVKVKETDGKRKKYWGEKEAKSWRVNEKKMRLIERIKKQDEIRLEIKLNSVLERKKG